MSEEPLKWQKRLEFIKHKLFKLKFSQLILRIIETTDVAFSRNLYQGNNAILHFPRRRNRLRKERKQTMYA